MADPVTTTWEMLSDVYRDVVLTGILGSIMLAAFRVGALHTKVMDSLNHFQETLDGFQHLVSTLTHRVDEGFKEGVRRNDAVVREVQRLEVQTVERLAKAEEALRAD